VRAFQAAASLQQDRIATGGVEPKVADTRSKVRQKIESARRPLLEPSRGFPKLQSGSRNPTT